LGLLPPSINEIDKAFAVGVATGTLKNSGFIFGHPSFGPDFGEK
jgi:hypothetical protein